MRRMMVLLLLASLFAISCSNGGPAQEVDDSWTVRQDADDVSSPSDTRPDKSQPVRFRLVNQTDDPVEIQAIRGCRMADWVRFQADKSVYGKRDCPTCRCRSLRESGECFRCDDGSCDGTNIEELSPGESVEWTWIGRVFEEGNVDGETCYREQTPFVGTEMAVRMCWGGSLGHGVLSGQDCAEKTFEYGSTSEVEHAIVD